MLDQPRLTVEHDASRHDLQKLFLWRPLARALRGAGLRTLTPATRDRTAGHAAAQIRVEKHSGP